MKTIIVSVFLSCVLTSTSGDADPAPFSLVQAFKSALPLIPDSDSFIGELHFASREEFSVVFKRASHPSKVQLPWSIEVLSNGNIRPSNFKPERWPRKLSTTDRMILSAVDYLNRNGRLTMPCLVMFSLGKGKTSTVIFERLPAVPGGTLECDVDKDFKILRLRRGQ